ncbi:MAG: cation:proton antiporter [Planctomycetes bacterium]|nr:cation:proton antiporter [Planctomycetota bacterium]
MLALANTDLIATIAVSLSAALGFGVLARKLRLSPIVGYMLAGVLVGPHTPGFVADVHLAEQLAEIGIALLMFGVGLHFSLSDLLAVRRVAVPGAIGQCAFATAAGALLGWLCGWGWVPGLVFGMALSVASTVVLVRGLTDLRQMHSVHGHVAVGWLVVEDLLTVLMLIALPALAGGDAGGNGGLLASLGGMVLKIAGLGVLYVVGQRVVPWFLQQVARLQSRELFTLAVLGIALGVAFGSAVLFDVSMALGAFLGGMIVGQSESSHQAAADALPLRDAFAVLFFVSVGMLFDPGFVVERPGLVLGALAIILVVKPVAALAITLMVGYPIRTAVTVAAGLAQIGEFSFIVGHLGKDLKILSPEGHQAIVVAALVSIALNPLCFAAIAPMEAWLRRFPGLSRWIADRPGELAKLPSAHDAELRGHAVVCGHGRSGRVLARLLRERQWPLLVIDQDRATVQALRREGVAAIHGDAANPFVLERAALAQARIVVVTLSDPISTRQIVEFVRHEAPELEIIARVQSEAERHELGKVGRADGVLAEEELAIEMARHVVQRFGASQLEAQAIALDLRRGVYAPRDGARVLEIRVRDESRAAGRPLADLGLGKGILVMAIDRKGALLVPDGQTRLEVGDLVLLITSGELTAQAKELL